MSSVSPEGFLQQPSHGSSATTNGSAVEDSAATVVVKKKRNHSGNPDPDAEVIALSPGALMATNRYTCEVCHKGFQRDQNLQLHRRGHNLPWKLKQRSNAAPVSRRVYICPETACPHHDPSRALGDLTGIKKHYCRKHGEKKWKCDKCSKRYAVQSDWKAHAKICGTREYRCDCGTIFSRRDSFITHRAFCDALAEENYKMQQALPSHINGGMVANQSQELLSSSLPTASSSSNSSTVMNLSFPSQSMSAHHLIAPFMNSSAAVFSDRAPDPAAASQTPNLSMGPKGIHTTLGRPACMSATALLQKAAEIGAMVSDRSISPVLLKGFAGYSATARSCGSNASAQVIVPATVVNHSVVNQTNTMEYGKSSQHSEFRDPAILLQSENRNEEDAMGEGGLFGGMQKAGFSYGGERATADFLSLGLVASNGGIHTPLEKSMWNF